MRLRVCVCVCVCVLRVWVALRCVWRLAESDMSAGGGGGLQDMLLSTQASGVLRSNTQRMWLCITSAKTNI